MSVRIPSIITPIGLDVPINELWFRYLQALQESIPSAFPDAPADGTIYGRRNNVWTRTIQEAPIDGFTYGRNNGAWTRVGGTDPALPYRSIQFNEFGAFGGSANWTFDSTISQATLIGSFKMPQSGRRFYIHGEGGGSGTISARLAFQCSEANQATVFNMLPNGTSQISGIALANNSIEANATYLSYFASANNVGLSVNTNSGAPPIPLVFQITPSAGSSVRYSGACYPGGNWNFFDASLVSFPSDPGYRVQVDGSFNLTGTLSLNGSAGTSGYVLTSQGAGVDPIWAAVPSGVPDGDKGDITVSGGGTTWSIDTNVVTNAKLAQVSTATFKGRVTAGTGNVEDLTGTQATTLLDVFTSALKGLVPASGGGTTNFLRADGSWAVPPGGGGGTPGGSNTQVQYNNAGAFGGITNLTSDGTNVTAETIAGDLTFSGNSRRILAPMSTGASTDFQFQTTAANNSTVIQAIPNGTSTTTGIRLYNTSGALTNVPYLQFAITNTAATLDSTRAGTGTPLPFQIRMGNTPSVAMTIQTNGNTNIGTTTTDPGVLLNVEGALTIGGNFVITGTGRRIQADFSNATATNKAFFQTATANSGTAVGAIPNGTGTNASFQAIDNSTPTNAGYVIMYASTTGNFIDSARLGTGTAQDLTFRMGSGFTTTMKMYTTGRVSVGTATAETAGTEMLQVGGSLSISSATMIRTYTAFTNGAGVGAGTLTNAPAAGNPTKWIPINDNGTTRYIPAW